MAMRIPKAGRSVGLIVAVVAIAVLAFALGSIVSTRGGSDEAQYAGSTGAPSAAPDFSATKDADGAVGQSPAVEEYGSVMGTDGGARSSAGVATGEMIIRTNNVELRVDSVEEAIDSIRTAARAHDATITDLSVTAGSPGDPRPLPYGAQASYQSPANAYVTIRVPANNLDALERAVIGVGKLITQSGSSSDVTQQHIDMSARLENLKAQEKRLRGFFERASKVTDLLEVERELSRVRAEIESMQGQVDYLERQAAMSTLTVSLTEPGPVVSPSGADWGFEDAVREGIQAAATLVTGLITLVIALIPVLVLLAILWFLVRVMRRRSRSARPGATSDDSPVTAEDEDDTTL